MNAETQFISDTRCFNSYSKGWKLILANLGILFAVALIGGVIRTPMDSTDDFLRAFGDEMSGPIIAAVIIFSLLWSIFFAGPVSMSASWVFLKAARGETLAVRNMFSVFERNYWSAVGAGLAKFILVVLGLALLIVPGIYIACRLAFVEFLVIDRKMKVGEAFSTSWAMTKGHGWTIFGMGLLAVPLIVVGLLALIVGVFVAVMWVGASFAILYHSIELKEGLPGTGTRPIEGPDGEPDVNGAIA